MANVSCPSCQAESETADYCDSCGTAIDRPARVEPPSSAATAGPPTLGTCAITAVEPVAGPGGACPGCGTVLNPGDLFCERCGVNVATGQVAAPSAGWAPPGPGPERWTAVVSADRALFDRNQAECAQTVTVPDSRTPREVPLQGDEIVVGRRHESEGFFPDIDLAAPVLDPGVSRRHAVLRRQADGTWAVVDTGSTNGTWLNADAAPLKPGVPVVLRTGDRIQLGLFTVITVRHDAEATN